MSRRRVRKESLTVKWEEGELQFTEEACFQSRGRSVAALIKEAFDGLGEETRGRMTAFEQVFYLGDVQEDEAVFSFGGRRKHRNLIPCYVFHSWPEAGIEDYDRTCEQIGQRGNAASRDDRLFWIGNVGTHPTRQTLMSLASQDERIQAVGMRWSPDGEVGKKLSVDGTFVSLPDHGYYKYLIDLQGVGYSGRTKILLHSGRPLFYQERKYHEHWFFDLQPLTHYIPVKEDLSDLRAKLDWAETHPRKCREIASKARQFAHAHLRRENAVARFKEILLRLGKEYH